MNWTLICRGKAGWCCPDLYLPTLLLSSPMTCISSLVRINPALLLLSITAHLEEAPSDICRFLELSFAAKNYKPSTEKHSAMWKPMWPRVFMPDPVLVRISPGDKILSGTKIFMKQTKAQGMTLDNSTNPEKDTSTWWQTKRWPNTSRYEYQTNYSGNKTTKQTAKTANRSRSNCKTTLASIRVAVE